MPLLDAIYTTHSIDTINFNGEKGEKALLVWCQKAAEDDKIKINDFTSSWNDGKAVSAIINKFKPRGMNSNQISSTLGIQFKSNICDKTVNILIASQLYHTFSDPTQTLSVLSNQEMKKNITLGCDNFQNPNISAQTQSTNIKINSNNDLSSTNNNHDILPLKSSISFGEHSKIFFKKLFVKKKSEKKINIKIQTPEFIKPNFEQGIIQQNKLSELMNQDEYLPRFINNRFTHTQASRYPVQVAHIPEGANKVDFKRNELKSVLERAGSRPIICVSILGSYQQGKSSTLGGLTGSYGYATGNSMRDKTKGVYIDGPYDIDYLYQRFDYKQSPDNFYLKVDALKPVVFFFDIEGYGGLLHGEEEKKNTNLFIQLCTPFMCISSVFIYLSPAAPQVHEIQTIVDTMRISTLTSVPKNLIEDSNGELKMIIAIKSFKILPSREDPYSRKEIEEEINDSLMHKIKGTIKSGWQGKDTLDKSGIHAVFSPLMDKENIIGYTKTFGYFARDVISGIEVASQGHFMRGYRNSINLFEFIVSHYHDGKFSDKIKERISEEYKNTLGRMALRTLYIVRDEVSLKLDKEYVEMEKNVSKSRKSLNDLKKEYFKFGQEIMERKLDVVGDTSEVHRYYQLLCYFISEMIDKKEKHFRDLINTNQAKKKRRIKRNCNGILQ